MFSRKIKFLLLLLVRRTRSELLSTSVWQPFKGGSDCLTLLMASDATIEDIFYGGSTTLREPFTGLSGCFDESN